MIIPSFLYINNSLHLPRKYARIFVRGHYLFREANSFPRAKLEENCEFRGTDNVQGQICKHIFAANEGYCVYYPSVLKIGEYPLIFPSFSWGIFAHVMRLDQLRASKNISWIIIYNIGEVCCNWICTDGFQVKSETERFTVVCPCWRQNRKFRHFTLVVLTITGDNCSKMRSARAARSFWFF